MPRPPPLAAVYVANNLLESALTSFLQKLFWKASKIQPAQPYGGPASKKHKTADPSAFPYTKLALRLQENLH
jgi:hypothetical protein